jgi:hypothetical protein
MVTPDENQRVESVIDINRFSPEAKDSKHI